MISQQLYTHTGHQKPSGKSDSNVTHSIQLWLWKDKRLTNQMLENLMLELCKKLMQHTIPAHWRLAADLLPQPLYDVNLQSGTKLSALNLLAESSVRW